MATRHLQPVQILRQSPVAHLGELEEPLDHPEGMLDSAPATHSSTRPDTGRTILYRYQMNPPV